ncbi:MAG: ATP-binding protein [Bacteroidota bacterium]
MKFINRSIEDTVRKSLKPNKVVIILGARRVGKTELIKRILQDVDMEVLNLNGEDEAVHSLLETRSVRNYKQLLGKAEMLIIDEAQVIPEIGKKLKLMVDSIDGLKVLVSGSSVFDMNNQLGEPLVGRSIPLHLYPLSQIEYAQNENLLETKSILEERLIFGSYPELEQLGSREEKVDYLKEIVNSYLFKDILAFEGIRKREKIVALLRMIAFRVGSEISIESIGNKLQMSKTTVDKYLDLLSKVFIIHRVGGFSRNLDNEITKKAKWYFYDNGIRNALINNFNLLNVRDDHGKIWENYLISERLKKQAYEGPQSLNYFWRTHTKQEIDWVEEIGGKLHAYEFKWNAKTAAKTKVPASWKKAYPEASFKVIHPDNYLDFIT